MFNQSILSDIRDRIPIVAFINERVPLKKAGRNYKGLCPFHQEKTASFMVSDEKQIFHCFGCGEGGDIFKFLMKYEGLSFAESMRTLAERAGVTLPQDVIGKGPDEELLRKKKWAYRLNEIAAEYFRDRLISDSGRQARNYLKSRGIKDEIWTQLFLGYAEKGWDGLVRHLEEKKAPLSLAAELGLIKKRSQSPSQNGSDGYYDFFRSRLMFPIISPRGEVLGFSGRVLDEQDKEAAKYLNSPDSLVYHKSNCVFGLHLAADAIRKDDRLILVEGNIDLISLFQAGVQNVVAPLGTAFTGGHIRLLKRYTRNMVVIFDGDEAGIKAANRALPLFIEEGLTPRAVALPKGEDPDSFVRKSGVDKIKNLIGEAPTLFEHVIDIVASQSTNDTAGRIQAMQQIIPLLRKVAEPVELGMYRGYAAKRLHVKEEIIRESLQHNVKAYLSKKAPLQRSDAAVGQPKQPVERNSAQTAERLLIETMIGKPHLIPKIWGKIAPGQFSDRSCRTIAEIIVDEQRQGDAFNLNRLLDRIADPDLAVDLRSIALNGQQMDEGEAQTIIEDCLASMEKRPLTEKIEQVNEAIREAESEGNEELLFELLAKKRDLAAAVIK